MSVATDLAIEIVQHQLSRALPHHNIWVRYVAPTLQIHIEIPAEDPQVIRQVLHTLKEHRYNFANLAVETVAIYGMQGQRIIRWKKALLLKAVLDDRVERNNRAALDDQVERNNTDAFSYENKYINRFALPIAFVLNALITWSGLGFLLIGMKIWIHEFGHAVIAWFSGRGATPLPLGWTNYNPNKSVVVYCCFFILWALLFYTGWKEKKRLAMGIAVIAVLIQFAMTWFMSTDDFEMWLAFGGVAGEFYLSALLVLSFYVPLPDRWHWDFWRYPALLMGAHSFSTNFSFWHQVKQGAESIPWGTMLNGSGDAGGDMNQLRDLGWSDGQIIHTYIALGQVCFWMMVAVYVLRSVQLKQWGTKL